MRLILKITLKGELWYVRHSRLYGTGWKQSRCHQKYDRGHHSPWSRLGRIFTDDNISMGFRRLSIIDLGAGHQPIYNEDKSLVLTFNGEIYNYKDLRKELIAKGHKFYTDTDSEVLVHGFEEWKEDMLPKLRGMFGFAIYNTRIIHFLLPVTFSALSRCTTLR